MNWFRATTAKRQLLDGRNSAGRAAALLASGVTAAALAVVGAAPPATAAPVPTAASTLAATPQAPTVKTTISVGGKVGDAPPAPPADAMGTPAASTLARADDVAVTDIVSADHAQSVTDKWESVDYAGAGNAELQGAGTYSRNTPLNPSYPTAAGRFLDPNTDRTMSLQLTALDGGSFLQLSSNNLTTEGSWDPLADRQSCPMKAGVTCGFYVKTDVVNSNEPADALTELPFSSNDRQVWFQLTVGPRATAPSQLWTAVDTGDPDGYLELANKADGLCLTVDRLTPIMAPCTGDVTQLWKWDAAAHTGPVSKYTASGKPAISPVDLQAPAEMVAVGSAYDYSAWQVAEPGGSIPTWSIALSGQNKAVPTALATGDLDRVVGADDNYHDEAVVAWGDPTTHQLQVRVIDYNANASHLLATAPDVALPSIGAVTSGTWYPGSVGVAVGDFAGTDALNQIAVTWQDKDGAFHATLLAYAATDDGGRSLTVIGTPAGTTLFSDDGLTPTLASGWAQTVAGDFEGADHADHADLAIAYAAYDPGFSQLSGHLGVVSFTTDFKLRGENSTQFSVASPLITATQDDGTWTPHGIRLGAGYFKDDAADGYTFQRRELAVTWTEGTTDEKIGTAILDVADDASCTDATCTLDLSTQAGPSFEVTGTNHDLPIASTVGGFEGVGTDTTPPVWDILTVSDAGISVLKPDGSGLDRAVQSITFAPNTETQIVLTAYDRDGASLVLGAPLVLTTTNYTQATLVAAQPPVHADWLDGHYLDISRFGSFAVTMASSQTQSYSYTHTNDANFTEGYSVAADISTSVRAGTKDVGATSSYELKAKTTGTFSQISSNFTKYSTTITSTATGTTTDDDFVQGFIQTQYFYRYPVLNHPTTDTSGDTVYPFFQIYIPGQVVQASGPGRNDSWYQPSWENGNVLSYPKLVDGQVVIPDLGSYSYVDDTGATVQVTKPLFNEINAVGGTAGTDTLEITGKTGSGQTTENTSKYTESIGVTATFSMKEDLGAESAKATGSVSLGFNASQALGVSDVGSSSASSSKSFELDVPLVDGNKGYEVGTAYYYDIAGVPTVRHAVDLTSGAESSDFWKQYYASAPDPALNLPDATILTYDQYNELTVITSNTLASRQLIRGFAALQPYDPSSPMTSGQPYGTDPESGDPVTFAVQVHDFSLMGSPSVPVEFYAVPVDSNGINVTGPPQPIGTVQSGPIPSQGYVTVDSPTWTAEGSGNATDAQNWRIFVVVDPDNNVSYPDPDHSGQMVTGEIHPWQATATDDTCPASALDPNAPASTIVDTGSGPAMVDPMTGKAETLACGQNNQGFGTITVMPKSLGAPLGSGPAPTVNISGAGFVGGFDGAGQLGADRATPARSGARHDRPTLQLDQNATGVIQTSTTANTATLQPVLVYDGPPSDGRLIAATTMNGATKAGGGNIQFTWRPSTAGKHTLYLLLVGETASDNSLEKLPVDVVKPAAPPPPPHHKPPHHKPPHPHAPPADRPAGAPTGPQHSNGSGPGNPRLAATGTNIAATLAAALALLAVGLGLTVAGRRRGRVRL